jgi:hypothetical protein
MAANQLPAQNFFDKHRKKIALGAPNECWLWAAGKNNNGYGLVRARGSSRYAHREAYEAENGRGSAEGFVCRHRCDTPACVNPAHLEIGTQADNVCDMIQRGRRRIVPSKGEAHGNAKLTDADVIAIRSAYVFGSSASGTYALGRQFGVDPAVIGRIVRRLTWRHIS